MEKRTQAVLREVSKAVMGKDEVILRTLMAMLAKGHILLEDCPGVGKTTLAVAFSKAMGLDYKRIQFTPEIMPADVVGYCVLDRESGKLRYRPGPILCNLFLADEINRTSSKTQSALLEAMEEGQITLEGMTRPLPQPFTVIATQNPAGSAGTQLLPESQLDRFMLRLSIGYPSLEHEMEILRRARGSRPVEDSQPVLNAQTLTVMQEETEQVYLADELYRYIASLAAASRENRMVRLGISPRGAAALLRAVRACAFVHGRDYVIPDDIHDLLPWTFSHRLSLLPRARAEGATTETLLSALRAAVPAPTLLKTK